MWPVLYLLPIELQLAVLVADLKGKPMCPIVTIFCKGFLHHLREVQGPMRARNSEDPEMRTYVGILPF